MTAPRYEPRYFTAEQVLAYLTAAPAVEVGLVLARERRGLARAEILSKFPAALGGRPNMLEEGS